MASANNIRNVIVLGAGGTNIGHHIVNTLLADPTNFTVSILSRKSSKSTFPPGAKIIYVDDSLPHDELVKAFQGQDAVVSAVGAMGFDAEKTAIDAAIEAGVKRFIPSEYGVNNTNPKARALCPIFDAKGGIIDYLKTKESTGLSWTAVANGLWLEWALNPAIAFLDINIATHTALLWDGGNHQLSFTTLSTAADGVRRILLTPVETANKVVPIRNFEVSQVEIVAALEKAQGVQYTVSQLDSKPLVADAQAKWASEKDIGSALLLVKAGFYLKGYGSNFVTEGSVPVGNDLIGFPELSYESAIEDALTKYGIRA